MIYGSVAMIYGSVAMIYGSVAIQAIKQFLNLLLEVT